MFEIKRNSNSRHPRNYYILVNRIKYLHINLVVHSETLKDGLYTGYYATEEDAQETLDRYKQQFPEECI